MDERRGVGVLVVGLGRVGTRRARAVAREVRRLGLVAVHDRDPGVARRVASRHGAMACGDLDEALDLRAVGAVVVATPTSSRPGLVARALAAGKHVFCEAPLAVRGAEARALIRQAADAHLRLVVGSVRRFDPPIRDALGLADAWGLGAVESVRVEVGHRASLRFLQSWRTEVARSGGGALMHHGPVACDLIRRILGEVVLVKGFVRQEVRMPPGCESSAFALFRNHDNAVAELHASWTLPRLGLRLDIRGEGGHLRAETHPWRLTGRLGDGRTVARRYRRERLLDRLHRLRFGAERSIAAELDAFAAGITDPNPAGDRDLDGARVVEMIRAVYQADRTGDEVHLRPFAALAAGVGR